MAATGAATTPTAASPRPALAVPFLVGGAVALLLGVYSRNHHATHRALFTLFFSGTINLKTWFATLTLVFGTFQVLSALRLYGKIHVPATMPTWLGQAHRLSGTLTFIASLPVAYHCLWSLGFVTTGSSRVVIHSVLGCMFYGAFAAKVIIVRAKGMPGWALPVVGGVTFALLVGLWLTSVLWFFRTAGFPSV